jgi:branched-chain amino acid transport system ATP-binding protein
VRQCSPLLEASQSELSVMTSILRVENVSKRYGALVVTDDLSLDLEDGEAVGVIGPNGAGKSTMFNLIAGGVRPDAGRITFRGADITRMPSASRCKAGIGRSYQIPHPFTGMTVFENLLVGATFGDDQKESDAYPRCVGILDRTGLLPKANAKAGSLTLLERKRLEMARALATNPKLLLLDEIAGGLTEHECHDLVATIRSVHDQGVSIIWIEHVLHALRAIVSRLVVIDFGRKIADGAPDAVMNTPEVREIYMWIEAEPEEAHA